MPPLTSMPSLTSMPWAYFSNLRLPSPFCGQQLFRHLKILSVPSSATETLGGLKADQVVKLKDSSGSPQDYYFSPPSFSTYLVSYSLQRIKGERMSHGPGEEVQDKETHQVL